MAHYSKMNLLNIKMITTCGFISLLLLSGCGLKGDLYQTPPSAASEGIVPVDKSDNQNEINPEQLNSSQPAIETTTSDNNINNPSSK